MPEVFTILVDGGCPVCRHESRVLSWLDRGRGRLRVVDIASPGYDPGEIGCTLDEVMGEIHGIGAGGEIVRGMEVFRRAYAAVGLGWVLAPTRWPVIRPIADAAYRGFARNRVRLFGGGCGGGGCGVDAPAARGA